MSFGTVSIRMEQDPHDRKGDLLNFIATTPVAGVKNNQKNFIIINDPFFIVRLFLPTFLCMFIFSSTKFQRFVYAFE